MWATRRTHRRDPRRAAVLLWGGWALVHFVVFSFFVNPFHPYYTSALAPAVAVLAASALVTLWDGLRSSPWMTALASATLLASVGLAVLLLSRSAGFVPWLPWVLAGSAIGAVFAGLRLRRTSFVRARRLRVGAVTLGLTSLLAGPAAFAVATVGRPLGGVNPVGGPARAIVSSRSATDPGVRALARYLSAHRGNATYLAAISGSAVAARLTLATRQPVITMGGFGGTDPAPTALQLQELVKTGKVRFVVIGDSAPAAVRDPTGPGLGGDRMRARWVTSHCIALSLAPLVRTSQGDMRERLWDCASLRPGVPSRPSAISAF
jgi:4-amino-4-deoxy-L-arabinose transferase-like glycosyltransferase